MSGARQHRSDTGHFAGEDRVPSLEKLGVGDVDSERAAQAFEESGVADLAPFVPPPGIVGREPPDQLRRLAAGMAGPTGHHLVEVDIEHDPAEIEQQRVGGVGESGEFMPVVYKTGGARATGRVPLTNPVLKPERKLC